jgi:tetratricopeptide (TPR) repeat protein
MKSTNLGIKRQMVGCNCEDELLDQTLAEGVALFEEPMLTARRIPAAFTLTDATRQWDFGTDELEVIFKVSKTEIDSTVFNNEVTFGKILSAIDKIFANPKYKVDKIEIAGYASPEGKRSFNNWLGENRAKALIDYIIEHRPQYNLTPDNFRLRNGEENWEGLRRLVLTSSIEEKDQVAQIIDMDLPDEEKKLKIKAIDNGRVWVKMLREVYPHLRSARFLAVYYDSTEDEAVDMINLANQMIREGDYTGAYQTVEPYSDDLRAYNTVGTALMMQGRFEEALPWLEKAVENNTPAAQNNIDLIKAELEYEAGKKAEIEEYLKRFE